MKITIEILDNATSTSYYEVQKYYLYYMVHMIYNIINALLYEQVIQNHNVGLILKWVKWVKYEIFGYQKIDFLNDF